MGQSLKPSHRVMDDMMCESARGNVDACFELGMAYSCGSSGYAVDLVQAHKWFNLAALRGDERGQQLRAEIAEEMSAREIAEAQRQARAWLNETTRLAA